MFNRPGELRELLESLAVQSYTDFEVIVVDDGSESKSDEIVALLSDKLRVRYFFKPNSGPGPSRNFGFDHANGDYFIAVDSDCLVPPDYLELVDVTVRKKKYDAWGGPDRVSAAFTALQQAMGITMSSFLTTGGIRGGVKRLDHFLPRSFNLGISREVYKATGGFRLSHYAEDIELSIRLRKMGFRVGLIQNAFVYHKRRTSLKAFFKQVYNFGRGRVRVGKLHPESVRWVHWLPALFVSCMVLLLAGLLWRAWVGLAILGIYLAYFLGLFYYSWRQTRSLLVAALCIPAGWVQLTGYGLGFIRERLRSSSTRGV